MSLFSRSPFQVSSIEDHDVVRLILQGELDLATVDRLVTAIELAEERRPELLVLDAEHLSFIDASGFKVLLRTARRARKDGRRVHLLNPTRSVRRILRITAIDQTLDVVTDSAATRG
jgi:anti-sigma B factor antagonist